MGMKLREEKMEDKLVFYLDGELVAKEKVSVLSAIIEAVEREKDISSLVLEMSRVSYLDSSGLGMLLNLKERMEKRGGELILVGLSEYAKKLLSLTHLDKAFKQFEAMDDLLMSSGPVSDEIQEGKMEIPSDLEYVQEVSRRIISILQKYKLPETILMDMRLLVEEMVINGIRHGNKFASENFVLIEYRATPASIELTVRDEGEGFDYNNVEGKGLKLIKSIADEVEFSRGGSQIRIVKQFR